MTDTRDEGNCGPSRKKRRKRTTERDHMGRERATYEEDEQSDPIIEVIGDYQPKPVAMADALELDDAAKVRITSDGYLTAMPRIARAGVQVYRGSECGRPDIDLVRVYRPVDSVFATDAIKSLAHKPVTIDHPKERVTSDNWKKYAVGQTGEEPLRDGQAIRIPMVLMDKAAIDAVRDGKRELSVGYTCNLDWTNGVTEDGEQYDAVQKDIRANHLAVVAAARGGATLKIGDDATGKEAPMELKTVVVDGINVQMSDTAAQVVSRTISKLTDQIAALTKDSDADESEHKAELAKRDASLAEIKKQVEGKDGEIEVLKKQLKDASDPSLLDAQLKERQGVVDKARIILKDKLVIDGKSVAEIRKQVVIAKVGDVAKDWSDGKIEGAFDTLTVSTKPDPVRAAVHAFTPASPSDSDPRQTAYGEMVRDMSLGRAAKAS